MSEWIYTCLSEIADITPGFAFKSKDFGTSGEIVIKIKDINPPYVNYEHAEKVDIRNYNEERLKRFIVQKGDYVLAMTGATIGKIGKVVSENKAFINQRVAKINAKNGVNNKFVFYSISDSNFQSFIQNNIDSNSAQENISANSIGRFPILLPPLREQERIAEVLSSLDDKIDLLHRNNKTLEQLAESLFRQWFVEEAEDEVNEISLSEISKHVKKSVNPSKSPDQFFKHYSIPAYDNGRNPETQLGRDILSNKYAISPGQILISKLNPRTPRVWFINSCNNDSVCSTEFQVYEPIKKEHTEFIYCLLKSNDTRDILTGASSGTSGSHQRVNPEDINKLTIKKPNEEKIKQFHHMASVWLNKIDKNSIQIQQLETLRDTLLPKLMSGEVRVKTDA